MYWQSEKILLNSNTSSTCPHNTVNFGWLTAEISSGVWGTPANFNGFHVLAALLHDTLVVGVSQPLWRWTEGATYIRQGVHHVGHWPTFWLLDFCVPLTNVSLHTSTWSVHYMLCVCVSTCGHLPLYLFLSAADMCPANFMQVALERISVCKITPFACTDECRYLSRDKRWSGRLHLQCFVVISASILEIVLQIGLPDYLLWLKWTCFVA